MTEVEELFRENVEFLRVREGSQALGRCPFHEDESPSLAVDLEKGLWKCHAGCGQGNAKQFAAKLGDQIRTAVLTMASGGNAAAAIEAYKGGSKLRPIRMRDLIEIVEAAGEDKDEWFVEKLIAAESVVMLAASPKAGKSTFAAALVAALSTREDFVGLKTQKVRTLWLGLEERRRDVSNKFKKLGVVSGVRYLGGPLRASPAVFEGLSEAITRHGVRLLIIDTLANFWSVRDENSAPETERALEPIRQLARDLKIAVLILHHTRKGDVHGGESIRGSSAIFGVVDAAIAMSEQKGLGETARTLEVQSRLSGHWQMRVEYSEGRYKAVGKDDLNARDRLLLQQLTHKVRSAERIGKRLGLRGTTARRACEELARKAPKLIRVRGSGKKGDPRCYGLRGGRHGKQ